MRPSMTSIIACHTLLLACVSQVMLELHVRLNHDEE